MTDNLNLNSQLLSNESPLVGNTVASALDFDTQTERGAVSSMHIKDFSFSQGTGGTLTLTEGMSIKNSSGTTIIDSSGLVSVNNFTNAFRVDSSDHTTTGTTAGTSAIITGGTIGTLILTRKTWVQFYMNTEMYNDTALTSEIASSYATYYVGDLPYFSNYTRGITETDFTYSSGTITSKITYTAPHQQHNSYIYDQAAGTYVITIGLLNYPGAGTAHLIKYTAGFFVLGG